MAAGNKPDKKAAAAAIDVFLRAIGRDPKAEPAIIGTGARVADAFIDDLCAGYHVDGGAVVAENAIDGDTDLVVVRDIAVATTCPHHLMPASGLAHVAFAPRGRIVGVGAVGALVDVFAHRLTLQEEIGQRVADTLADGLGAAWAACRLVLSHSCMTARGERRHGTRVETVALATRRPDGAGAADGAHTGVERGLVYQALGVGDGR